ncbi:MAG: serine/threonine-protein phosphatase, partial [Planctomycetaceae bacterium]|nr:serine/threonine-protein phosphatase [Planctomycetaceae bacterium]
ATYLTPTKKFTFNCAGHPPPLYYSQKDQQWSTLMFNQSEASVPLTNLPLGVTDETHYELYEKVLDEGDFVLLFTDGLMEAEDRTGKVLGIGGLLNLLNKMPLPNGADLIPDLLETVRSQTGDSLQRDDLTLILCQTKKSEVNLMSNLLAPYRMLQAMLRQDHEDD